MLGASTSTQSEAPGWLLRLPLRLAVLLRPGLPCALAALGLAPSVGVDVKQPSLAFVPPRSRGLAFSGRGEQEDPTADLSSRPERTRQRRGRGAGSTAPQEQRGGRGRRGAHKRGQQPQAGARPKVPGCQEPATKKKRMQKTKK